MWSDHAPISLELEENERTSQIYIWRCQLLHLPQYQPIFSKHLYDFFANNAGSVKNQFTLWNGHKAYMRGVFIQISARKKRYRSQQLNYRLQLIHDLDTQNKTCFNHKMPSYLTQLCLDLRRLLIEPYDRHAKALKVN